MNNMDYLNGQISGYVAVVNETESRIAYVEHNELMADADRRAHLTELTGIRDHFLGRLDSARARREEMLGAAA